ncbi:MAG: peptide deformylase [Deltaproteobacteria bacterium]|nr:peptide deformylase [Deltaproteobacteria bacterium]
MSILKIATLGEPVLRQRARELSTDELASARWQGFIDDLIETMRDADGAGIAAPQVFTPVRVAVIEVKGNNPRYPYKPPIPLTVLVNPTLTPIGDERFDNYEGCLSVPDLRGVVQRHARVRVQYLDRQGQPHDVEVKGVSAGTFQHECDHLDGRVFVDGVGDPTTFSTWKNWERHHKAAFVERITKVVERYGS